MILQDIHHARGFANVAEGEESFHELRAEDDVRFAASADEIFEEVERLVELAGFAGSGEESGEARVGGIRGRWMGI